ncbi:urate hydroxylase PuuD [Bermanella sp. WJH001]|uniref:urate hydroxylase PuuD n=1 Tax=Bermanella sp. WJH001 TaxID=3048005 RepID=UPI0024BEACD5|nr:urate hydroxylase PuuD [Bermanella sp. WJH001]MDJ1538264.1 urate hydroxylase PuuD [Bermanella sp. WJH001]
MEAYLVDWLNLFFRWFHVIAGVAWIGASFYFVWLDLNLKTPPQWKKDKGIKGDLWAIHGGGIYEVAKYELEPQSMPEKLHWFKWEAYTTWLTGFALLCIMYYWGADQYLIDPTKMLLTQFEAIAISLGFLVGGFVFYELLVKSPLQYSPKLFGAILFAGLVFSAYALGEIFSDRAAYLHVGALIGTIMAGNVFFGIMPAQRELVRAIEAGEKPDARPAQFAKLRSTHNNYFTLPLIFIMISNHYPMTYGHEHAWLILALISFNAAFVRHYFNLKHQGQNKPWILVAGLVFLFGIIGYMLPKPVDMTDELIADNQVLEISKQRCASCHAAKPTQVGFAAAPGGIMLETLDELLVNKPRILQAVQSNYMPLANMTNMTEDERTKMIRWASE